ncbi:hypothetical protein PMV48_11950, partial [Enterococcus avium]|nr:hypothetical protein [Enterococcus avium]
MSKLNWFSGGKERSDQALALITEILRELDTDQNSQALQKILANYQNELRKDGMATLFLTKIIRCCECCGVMAPIAL